MVRFTVGAKEPPIQWAQTVLSSEANRPGSESHHSRPSSAKVNNQWSFTPLPHMHLWRAVGRCLLPSN